jgi:hypothetical protein
MDCAAELRPREITNQLALLGDQTSSGSFLQQAFTSGLQKTWGFQRDPAVNLLQKNNTVRPAIDQSDPGKYGFEWIFESPVFKVCPVEGSPGLDRPKR